MGKTSLSHLPPLADAVGVFSSESVCGVGVEGAGELGKAVSFLPLCPSEGKWHSELF